MAMGRPREFDVDAALDEAMEVFWRHGYEGATIAELTEAETRAVLSLALRNTLTKRDTRPPKKHGTIPL